jgi:hypothetical protein
LVFQWPSIAAPLVGCSLKTTLPLVADPDLQRRHDHGETGREQK